ncbi:endolytic transglycosylase MltG [Mesobacillus zeae]|uniref:endolytic transglycosylase MltG n=1 Tax=Mesobacillus zeae TaxID=1917180 RepID=UPI0015E66958|nr:endolytic transglycosylase MltG [Mesobacillus zeae]
MNMRTARMFALGMMFTLLIVWPAQYFAGPKEAPKPTVTDAKALLKKEDYKVLTKEEYAKLTAKVQENQVAKPKPAEPQKVTPSKPKPEDKEQTEKVNKEKEAVEKAKKEAAEKAEAEKKANAEKTFTLKITDGMSPGEIASQLKSNGIIKDSDKFEKYLIDNDYHTDIQIGTYKLNSKMDFSTVSRVITKNN